MGNTGSHEENLPHSWFMHLEEKPTRQIIFKRDIIVSKDCVSEEVFFQTLAICSKQIKNGFPIANINYLDVENFINVLSQDVKGWKFRLPSEAEWEAICKSETTELFGMEENPVFPHNINYQKTSSTKMLPVTQLEENKFGIRGMNGNIWEMCADNWHPNLTLVPTDGTAYRGNPEFIVVRGGCYAFCLDTCRAASRIPVPHDSRLPWMGFRLVAERDVGNNIATDYYSLIDTRKKHTHFSASLNGVGITGNSKIEIKKELDSMIEKLLSRIDMLKCDGALFHPESEEGVTATDRICTYLSRINNLMLFSNCFVS